MRRLSLLPLLLAASLCGSCAPRQAALLPSVPVTIVKEGPEAARPKLPPRPAVPPGSPAGPAAVPSPPHGDNGAAPPPAALPVAAVPAPSPRPSDNDALRAPADKAARSAKGADNGAVPPPVADNVPAAAPLPPPPPPAELYRKSYEGAIAATRGAIDRKEPLKALQSWVALEGTPWEREARFNQAVLLHLSGDLGEAERRYGLLVAADPPHEGAAANLLALYLMQGRRAEGLALVDRLFPSSLPPDGAPALPELSGNAAALLLDAGKPERAAPFLAAGAFRGAPPPSAAWNRAVLAWKLGKGEGAGRASALLPPATSALWPVKASRLAWERGDLERRIALLEPPPADDRRLSLLSVTFTAWNSWRKGELEAAEGTLRALLPQAPAEAMAGLGLVLAERGRWKEARTELEGVTARAPALADGWLNLGIFRELYEGKGEAALECYRRYVSLGGSRKEEVAKWVEWLERSPSR